MPALLRSVCVRWNRKAGAAYWGDLCYGKDAGSPCERLMQLDMRQYILFYPHTCCLPVKSFYHTAPPIFYYQPPTQLVESLHNCSPPPPPLPSVRCQTQASCAAVPESQELTATYFSRASHEKKKSRGGKKNTKTHSGSECWSCQSALIITCREACNLSIISIAATAS